MHTFEGIGYIQLECRRLHHIDSHPNIVEPEDADEPRELVEGSDDDDDLDSKNDQDSEDEGDGDDAISADDGL